MSDIRFDQIAPRCGSQSNAFEELCCQLARRLCPANAAFERYRGAGGDGGVECIVRLADGSVTGWQAKFVFDIDGLIAQADDSFRTAISVQKNLKKYVVCFPFDPTGKTGRTNKRGRPAKSETDKLDAWKADATKDAKTAGHDLTIELWPASSIRDLILQHDSSGGVRHYFFSETVLSHDWFSNHLAAAIKAAGPRYTPQLNVETDLWRWFLAFEGADAWSASLEPLVAKCREESKCLRRQVTNKRADPMSPPWPANELTAGEQALKESDEVLVQAATLQRAPTENGFNKLSRTLKKLQSFLSKLDLALATELDAAHGKGSAESKPFRTYQASYMCSFPAANLDAVRDVATAVEALRAFLDSPSGFLAFKKAFALAGAGGAGKTHGICDMARRRLDGEAYTCVLFGHQFNGQPAEWTRLIESLGLPPTLGKEGVLDSLNAAGEASGKPLIFCVDALNETRPRDYWLLRFLPVAHEFERRSFLKFCVSCRTSFLVSCLPRSIPYPIVEHKGFAGIEREGCNAFFRHYDLEPPLVPVLQPELSNPLYLKLVCETLKLKGLKQLPTGWLGITPVIREFLAEKERQFSQENGVSVGAAIVARSLLAIANAIASTGNLTLAWSEAQLVINTKVPHAATLPVIEWLVRADLLIEDGPTGTGPLASESVLRPAFERFGDFLVASELLPKCSAQDFAKEFKRNGNIQRLLKNPASVQAHAGIVSAISILVSEHAGTELPNLIDDHSVRNAALALTMRALPWRTSETFTVSTRALAWEALAKDGFATMDSVIALSVQSSQIDAYWIRHALRQCPMSGRDAFWCGYLHDRFQQNGIVKRLIEARTDVDLHQLDSDTSLRWALMMLLFTAAADRRVKDHATRAVVAIFRAKPDVIPPLLNELSDSDDDELRERLLLCAYGALIASKDTKVLREVAESLLATYQATPTQFQNAIIRDHIRCIGELAKHLGCLGVQFDPLLPSAQQKVSDWPLVFPNAQQVETWGKGNGAVSLLARSCLHDDFNHYSIGCLNTWKHGLNKEAIGGWILKHAVDEFSLDDGACDNYDRYAVYSSGGGRGKPTWAERIGKKYQWIGLFRLASRLHDNVPRSAHDQWDPPPVRTPLILVEERRLDPTLSHTVIPETKTSECSWLGGTIDLQATKNLDFAAWTAKRDDLPLLESVLQTSTYASQKWIVLTAFPEWSEYRSDAEYGTPYRWTWFHIRSFLVPKAHLQKTVRALDGRDYFGHWLPDGGKWLHAFVGEYPWASACNTEPDWYLGASEKVEGAPSEFIHSSNQVVAEWEYDATLPKSIYLQVPTKKLFSLGDLWWNGTDGFSKNDGKTVFRDPRFTEGGPPALLADIDDLFPRLEKLGYGLIWLMLGEKNILGDRAEKIVPLRYSQWAFRNKDGAIQVGNRSFFHEFGKHEGFRTVPPQKRRRKK